MRLPDIPGLKDWESVPLLCPHYRQGFCAECYCAEHDVFFIEPLGMRKQ